MTIHVISKTIPERILKINMYYCLFQKSLIKVSESPKIIPEKMKIYFVKKMLVKMVSYTNCKQVRFLPSPGSLFNFQT